MKRDLTTFSTHEALIGVMLLASMSNGAIRTSELIIIENLINHSPVFADYDISKLRNVYQSLGPLMKTEDGLENFFDHLQAVLPDTLYETAYVMACDVAAAGCTVEQSELRFLEELACHLDLDPLYVSAIEWSAKVRWLKV